MGFLTNFFKGGGEEAMANIQSALIQAAPNLAGKAQLATMDQDLDQIGATISEFRVELKEAIAEHDEELEQYNELMGAAEVMHAEIAGLDSKITAAATASEEERKLGKFQDDLNAWTARKNSVTVSLNKLMDQIEHILPELDKDQARVVKLTEQLKDAEDLYKEKAGDMVGSGADLEEAKRDMKHAKLDEERAERDADRARRLAGLASSGTQTLTTATDAFRKVTEASRRRTEALDLKSTTLAAVKDTSKGDENIQAAILAAKGNTSPATLADRMAALRR